MGRLDGKVALITGGARGMGKSHARHFVAQGARVMLGDLLDDKGKELAAELGEDNCRYLHQDVTSESGWEAAVAATIEAFGALNVLVNNAGILKNAKIADMPLADFRQVIEVNLIGEWLGVKNVIAPMTVAGGGSIINISSVEGFTGAAGMSAYSASKFGVRGITRSAAQELGKFGIRVNSVHPGGIMTTMTATAFESFTEISDGEGFMRSLPISRFAKSSEVSHLVVYLASDESSYCTGSEFVVDGGMLSGPGY
jgi:3alpha(or 20beta)-hydroxysteroid dehydrogenase